MSIALLLQSAQSAPPVVKVEHDDVRITQSCLVEPSGLPIVDDEGDGVVQIVGDGLVVEFVNTPLVGAASTLSADRYSGIGVRITGRNVTVRGASVSGFKAGIWASRSDGLVLEGCDVSRNFRQRLASTPQAEDGSDWLWPHKNDANEWLHTYGAGIYVEESKSVVLRRNVAREGQNGIALRRVDESAIYDNDMSFLSGWGLAMFRSSRNVVDHNSFDFCIRGYSHGRYARGQDSAGILFFEQCNDNLFAFNSATHGGDGFFGFAGLEALEGGSTTPGLGCNGNRLHGNDFSYAAAIGIEMTFSYGNVYSSNRLVGSNYGVWGGYSGSTRVVDNVIADNTLAGIAIEHGSHWKIDNNRFARNARALELWWDDDQELLAKPWAQINPTSSSDYRIEGNGFDADLVQLELRGPTTDVVWNLGQSGTDRARWKLDPASRVATESATTELEPYLDPRLKDLPGRRQAVGARGHLDGRDKIIVTDWGPYDWQAPYLQRVDDRDGAHAWRLLGNDIAIGIDAGDDVMVALDASSEPPVILVSPRTSGVAVPYRLAVRVPSRTLEGRGLVSGARWGVTVGRYSTDPREDAAQWRSEVQRGVSFECARLSLPYGGGGPSELEFVPQAVKDAKLGRERFGTLASTELVLPAGRFRLTTQSDDGVRVRVDGQIAIDNWTHHGPTRDEHELEFSATASHRIEVEHFELDGYAVLELELEPVEAQR